MARKLLKVSLYFSDIFKNASIKENFRKIVNNTLKDDVKTYCRIRIGSAKTISEIKVGSNPRWLVQLESTK